MEVSCSVSETSPRWAGCRSGCCVTTTPSDCCGRPGSIRRPATATTRADQLSRLNRIIALKDLGFTLDQVPPILDEKVDVTELRGMLRLRRAQLQDHLAQESARLARIEARLRLIETEGHMNTEEVILKSVPPMRLAELTAVAASYEGADIGPALSPLYPELIKRMEQAGVPMAGPCDRVLRAPRRTRPRPCTCHAAVRGRRRPTRRSRVRRRRAARHRAGRHVDPPRPDGRTSTPPCRCWRSGSTRTATRPPRASFAREVYLDYHPEHPEDGVTEMQLPVRKA